MVARMSIGGTLLLAAISLSSFGKANEPSASLPEMLDDAELRDLFFLDADRGWAVGDRGVLLRTSDGGRNWQLSDSPVNCRLESVHFVDDTHGWAVGGWTHPYTHQTTGVVLATRDGGQRWERVPHLSVPLLTRVHFQDQNQGWAVGRASHLFPSGVFRTRDGGRNWTSTASNSWDSWQDAVPTAGGVTMVGSAQVGMTDTRHKTQPLSSPGAGFRRIRGIASVGDALWIVGDGGLVLTSVNGGEDWQVPQGLPVTVAEHFDFRTITQKDGHIWIAGSPGTRIFHSADAGGTWEIIDTGSAVPIHDLQFEGSQRGWAAGSLGTVLATRDGGASWIRQRGNRRVGLLAIFSEPEDVPFELLARLSGDEGWLSAVEIINRRDLEAVGMPTSSAENRLHQAVIEAGGSAAETSWQFPLRQSGFLLSHDNVVRMWDTAVSGDSLVALEARIVRAIRTWQPAVVVTHAPAPDEGDPVGHLLNQMVQRAYSAASEPEQFPRQQQHLRLAPWSSNKLIAQSPQPRNQGLTLETSRLATRLGQTLSEAAANSRGLIREKWRLSESNQYYELLDSNLPRDLASRDFFRGISISPGGPGRRQTAGPSTANLRELTRISQKQRTVRSLIKRVMATQRESGAWLAQAKELTRNLSPGLSGEVLYQLADGYRQAGEYALAVDTLSLLVEEHPNHPLTGPALIWMLYFQNSAEIRWGLRRSDAEPIVRGNLDDFSSLLRARGLPNPRRTSPAAGTAAGFSADRIADYLRAQRLDLFAAPKVRFSVAAQLRNSGALREALRHYQGFAANSAFAAWRMCGKGETWILDGKGQAPKKHFICLRTSKKPHLDGVLDDPAWQKVIPLPLKSSLNDDENWPAQAWVTHDDEFLYLAAHCAKAPEGSYEEVPATRPRDAELRQQDRIDFFFDTDRDFGTYFQLSVDHRGFAADHCGGEVRWNPRWFIAADSDDKHWWFEAAIPLSELVPAPPQPRTKWAFGVQRTAPEHGVQSWSQPAAIQVRPEGFGYLQWQ